MVLLNLMFSSWEIVDGSSVRLCKSFNKFKNNTFIEKNLIISREQCLQELYYYRTQLGLPAYNRKVGRPYFEDGLVDTLQFMVNSEMEMVIAHNEGALMEELTMTLSREQCLQGFNNYRRRLGLAAYNSFFNLSGNNKTATELEKIYSSVESVEFETGVFTDKSSSGVLPTIKVLSNSYIINSILANHLTSEHSWAPVTFGGVKFFDLVRSATLNSLVFRNDFRRATGLRIKILVFLVSGYRAKHNL
ncbi:hypothetical protein QTP88_024175 [Uroleucon formosanum]